MSDYDDSFESEMDFTGDDIDRDGKGGGVAVGAYTFKVTNVILHTEKTGDLQLDLEVLNGTVPTEIGKTHHEYIKYPETSLGDDANGVRRSIIRQVLYALQLTTPEALKANPRIKVNWAMAAGRVCKGKLADDSYVDSQGDKKSKTVLFKKGHWCLWSPTDPKAAGIPGVASDGANPPQQPPQQPPQGQQPAGGEPDPFAGLPV